MEYIIAFVTGLIGFVFYQAKKNRDLSIEVRLADVRGQDKILKVKQKDVDEAIVVMDDSIAKIRADRESEKRADDLTPAERADSWDNSDD